MNRQIAATLARVHKFQPPKPGLTPKQLVLRHYHKAEAWRLLPGEPFTVTAYTPTPEGPLHVTLARGRTPREAWAAAARFVETVNYNARPADAK